MKSFRYYLEQKEVRRSSPDPQLAASLRKGVKRRLDFISNIKGEFSMFAAEEAYELLRALLEAKLAEAGYKSYSHVANIAFAEEQRFITEEETQYINHLRELRNASRYEGKEIDKEDIARILERLPALMKKLR